MIITVNWSQSTAYTQSVRNRHCSSSRRAGQYKQYKPLLNTDQIIPQPIGSPSGVRPSQLHFRVINNGHHGHHNHPTTGNNYTTLTCCNTRYVMANDRLRLMTRYYIDTLVDIVVIRQSINVNQYIHHLPSVRSDTSSRTR